jgi:hypothetical protein
VGSHLSLMLHVPATHLSAEVLQVALAGDFFRAAGVGGVLETRAGTDWFLGGYTLDSFVDSEIRLGLLKKPRPRAIEACAAAPGAVYRARIAAAIGDEFRDALADGERAEPTVETTFLDAPALTLGDLAPLEPWLRAHPEASVQVHGTVALAVGAAEALPWDRACRELMPPEQARVSRILAVPFAKLHVGAKPFARGTATMMVFTESQVWLQDAGALGGRVGAAEADENLRRLAAFTARLAAVSRPTSVEVYLDGSVFRDEAARLRAAFDGAFVGAGGPIAWNA